jgi:hypothetical protein
VHRDQKFKLSSPAAPAAGLIDRTDDVDTMVKRAA